MRVFEFKFVHRVLGALPAVRERKKGADDGAAQMTFPADVVVDRKHPPHDASVQEGHCKAHSEQEPVLAHDSTGEKEGGQPIN